MDKYINKEDKTIYVEQEQTKKSQIFTIKVSNNDQFVDIRQIVIQVPDWETKTFQIYSPYQNAYLNFQTICLQKYLLPTSYFQLQYVMIKYRQQQSQSADQSQQNKKQRSKQRNIRQVIQLVHRWRELHESVLDGKKINLQQAAKFVGISKKSLDDYFFQLRMGQKYGFDFVKNMDCKVGMLRSFVKQKDLNQKKIQRPKITARYPKKLKIMEQFANKLNLKDRMQIKVQTNEEQKPANIEKCQNCQCNKNLNLMDPMQVFWGSPFTPIQQKAILDCQNNFFKDFENLMQQPNDPFIPFTNFRKSKSIFGDQYSQSSISF